MGLGLWHNSANPTLQSPSPKNLKAFSRFPENPRGKRVHFLDLEASSGEAKFARTQEDFGSIRQLCRSSGNRRARTAKIWRKLGRNQGQRIVACASGGSEPGGSFWQPFWSHVGDVDMQNLEFSGGDSGNGGKGGDGGGNGDGRFDPSRHETHVSSMGEKESSDEEQASQEAPRSLDFGPSLLASLSSAAGDGEAPFGAFLFGRRKRPGAADETAASATSDNGSQGRQLSVMESRRVAVAEDSQIIQQKDGDEALAKRSETAALGRLQRETFEELMRVRERLEKLEFHTGLRKSKAQASSGEGAAKTRLKGEVCAGSAFLLLDEQSSRYSRAALEQAGLRTGMDARFTFETSYRERDVMITECSAGHSGSDGSVLGGPISVTKLIYNARVTDDLNVVVAPLGARGSDVTETVNPLQGQALTQFARVGPAMYQHCVGSALGATLRGKSALVSLSQYLSGWGAGSSVADAPLCLSTLAHVMFQPWENSVFSLSAVNRFWPSPPLPSFRGLHWSEMGPLVLSKTRHTHSSGFSSPEKSSSPRGFRTSMDNGSLRDFRTSSFGTASGMSQYASWGTPYDEAKPAVVDDPVTHGNAMQSIALAGEIDVGANVSLAGWAQADRGYRLDESEKKEVEWGVSLTKTVGKTVDWGLCVGSSKVDLWSAARNEDNTFLGTGDGSGEPGDIQLHMEAFMKLSMGRGFTLQPGLVYLLNKQSQTPAFMLRSSWAL